MGIEGEVESVETAVESRVKDVMRLVGRTLSDPEKAALDEVKTLGNHLYALVNDLGESRELSLAKTKLEEAVMWVSKHISA